MTGTLSGNILGAGLAALACRIENAGSEAVLANLRNNSLNLFSSNNFLLSTSYPTARESAHVTACDSTEIKPKIMCSDLIPLDRGAASRPTYCIFNQ